MPSLAPPPPPPPRQAVEVNRERIVAPPERFIAVSDDNLLQHFQGERRWMGKVGAAGRCTAGSLISR